MTPDVIRLPLKIMWPKSLDVRELVCTCYVCLIFFQDLVLLFCKHMYIHVKLQYSFYVPVDGHDDTLKGFLWTLEPQDSEDYKNQVLFFHESIQRSCTLIGASCLAGANFFGFGFGFVEFAISWRLH